MLPYVKNKKDKTFLDQWLVGEDLQGYLEPWKYAQLNMVERILLAQRIAGEQPQTMRAIADLYDLLPPDVDRFNFLFNTAVQGSVLEAGESLGKEVALRAAERPSGHRPAGRGSPPRRPGSGAQGGVGGGGRLRARSAGRHGAERRSATARELTEAADEAAEGEKAVARRAAAVAPRGGSRRSSLPRTASAGCRAATLSPTR